MIQFVSPDDEHDVLETCGVINRNKYIEKNLCITLIIYQEYRSVLCCGELCTFEKVQIKMYDVEVVTN